MFQISGWYLKTLWLFSFICSDFLGCIHCILFPNLLNTEWDFDLKCCCRFYFEAKLKLYQWLNLTLFIYLCIIYFIYSVFKWIQQMYLILKWISEKNNAAIVIFFKILSAITFLELHIWKFLCLKCYELKEILICRCGALNYWYALTGSNGDRVSN